VATVQDLEAEREAELNRLRNDGTYYARNCLRLVDLHGNLVPFTARKGQQRIEEAIQAQEAAGEPVRIIIDKARRVGSSTWAVQTLLRKVTQNANSQAQITAQDRQTARPSCSTSGATMYQYLPDEEWLKPPIYQRQRRPGLQVPLVRREVQVRAQPRQPRAQLAAHGRHRQPSSRVAAGRRSATCSHGGRSLAGP
jgi:hypothetical protein